MSVRRKQESAGRKHEAARQPNHRTNPKKAAKGSAGRKPEPAAKRSKTVVSKAKTLKVVSKPAAKSAAKPAKSAVKPKSKASTQAPAKAPTKPRNPDAKIKAAPKAATPKATSAPQPAKNTVTAKQNQSSSTRKTEAADKRPNPTPASKSILPSEEALKKAIAEAALNVGLPEKPAAPKAVKTTVDDMALDVEEKDELLEEEKKDLAKALKDDEDEPLETAFVPTDTSERYILVVDEEGQRRTETLTIVQQILPNAVVEVADDPEEALEIMQDVEFDTYVVNFLMPGYSASPFVKAVANHPDHPLLIGFAADKISDALDQKKGLKIIPLKRLFDLDVSGDGKDKADKEE